MTKENETIKAKLKNNKIKQWQLANKIGITETTLIVWLRVPLTQERRQRVNKALEELINDAE